MHTSAQLIELAKQRLALKHGLPLPMTDYRFQKLTGFRQQTISRWTSGKGGISSEFSARFAELTELPEAYVFACLEHERAEDPGVQRILETIAKKFRGRAAAAAGAAILAAGMSFAPLGNQAVASDLEGAGLYIMRSRRRRWMEHLKRLFSGVFEFPVQPPFADPAMA